MSKYLTRVCFPGLVPTMSLKKTKKIAYFTARKLSENKDDSFNKSLYSNHPLWKSFVRENFADEQPPWAPLDKKTEEKEMLIRGQLMVHRAIGRCRWAGHIQASLDPLGEAREEYTEGPWLPRNQYSTASLLPYSARVGIRIPHNINLIGGSKKYLSVKNLFTKLKSIYSQSIGVEDIQQTWDVESWLTRRLELREKGMSNVQRQDASSRLVTLRRLVQAHSLEEWLLNEHPQLTSGLGAEILSISLQSLTDVASLYNGQHFNLSMSTTRGRLNVMLNAMRKPPEQVLAALEDFSLKGRYLDSSDRSSLGLNSSKVSSKSNDPLVLNLLSNVTNYPDSQIALLQGKCRADRLFYRDTRGNKVWPIIMHGDSAISSHGSIYEMMRLNLSPHYGSRGSIHLVISDQKQLGKLQREMKMESPYCTDVVKGANALLLHVNSLDIDAVNFCIETAVQYKARFHRSAMVNLVCTPEEKAKTPTYFWKSVVGNSFTQSLIKTGKTSTAMLLKNIDSLKDLYTSKYNLREFNFIDWIDSPWKNAQSAASKDTEPVTGIGAETMEGGLRALKELSQRKDIHQSFISQLGQRGRLAQDGNITWTYAEALAVYALNMMRIHVRLAGEEVLYPKSIPLLSRLWRLEALSSPTTVTFLEGMSSKASFTVCSLPGPQNSMLEYELGFSTANPRCLSVWQGGEGCLSRLQYLLDVYIAGGEVRWLKQTSLVMLFLHNENNGQVWKKENCSWRLLCNTLDSSDSTANAADLLSTCHLVVICPSTPANYFHALMRQVQLSFRKPTAIFVSPELFSSKSVTSEKKHFLATTKFQVIIPDDTVKDGQQVKRLIFSTGSVHHKLLEERRILGLEEQIALSRIEQISPFPYQRVAEELLRFPTAQIVWVQLQPADKAWYQYVKPRIESSSKTKRKCGYIGRKPSVYKDYIENLTENIVKTALTL